MKRKLLLALLIPASLFAQTDIAVTNSSFESTSNWTATNAVTSVDASGQTDNALSFTADAGSNATNLLTSDTFTIPNNSNCIVSLWVKSNAANQKVQINVKNDGSSIYTSAQINLSSDQGTWQKISSNMFSSGTPVDDSLWTISFNLPGGANKTMAFDELVVTANPLVVNGDFEIDYFHQTLALGLTNAYTKNQINPFSISTDFANSGSNSVVLTNVFSSGGKSTFNAKTGYQHTAEIGKNYQGSIYVRANTGETVNVKASLFLNGTENKGDDVYTVVSDSWTKISSPTVESTTTDLAYLRLTSETVGAVFYVDDVELIKSAVLSIDDNILESNIVVTRDGIEIKNNDSVISITDVLGKVILSRTVKSGNKLYFNFESSRIYFVSVQADNGNKVTKRILFCGK